MRSLRRKTLCTYGSSTRIATGASALAMTKENAIYVGTGVPDGPTRTYNPSIGNRKIPECKSTPGMVCYVEN